MLTPSRAIDLRENLRGIPFLPRQELGFVLHYGDARAQTAKRLREFATEGATADNGEPPRQLREIKDSFACYVTSPQPGKLWRGGNSARGHDSLVKTHV